MKIPVSFIKINVSSGDVILSSCRVADNIARSKMSVGGSIVEKKKKTLRKSNCKQRIYQGPPGWEATRVVAKLRAMRGARIILRAVYDDKKSLFV